MPILTTADLEPAASDSEAEPVTTRTPRAALLAGLRHNRYPVVPPSLSSALAAWDAAEALPRKLASQPVAGLGPFVKQVTEAALAGEPLPADFATAAHRAQVAADRQVAASAAVEQLRRSLEQRLPAVVTASLDGLLGGLRGQLDDLLGELRSIVDRLGSLDLADSEAVAAATDDERSALLALADLRARYNRLRSAQTDALQASDVNPPGATPLTVLHGWPQVFESGVHEFSAVSDHGNLPPARSFDRLRSLARRSDVWMPTVAQLRGAWLRLHPEPVRVVASPYRKGAA